MSNSIGTGFSQNLEMKVSILFSGLTDHANLKKRSTLKKMLPIYLFNKTSVSQ